MGKNGGKRPNAGRKRILKTEIIENLREQITEKSFKNAIDTLDYAMRPSNRKKNLKTAIEAAKFIVEQKIGKARQPLEHSGNIEYEVKFTLVE